MENKKTEKNDWLTEILSISGFVSNQPQLKFIKLNDFYCFYMLIDSTNYDDLINIRNSYPYKRLSQKIEGIFVMGYDDNKFTILDSDSDVMNEYNSETLKDFFRNLYPPLLEKVGAGKEVNKSTNDITHDWIRENLCMFAVINDIDAFHYHNDSIVFLELKRISQSSVYLWTPYVADSANYKALEYFKKHLGIDYKVIVYDKIKKNIDGGLENDALVGLHFNLNIGNGEITGNSLIISASNLVTYPFGKKYLVK